MWYLQPRTKYKATGKGARAGSKGTGDSAKRVDSIGGVDSTVEGTGLARDSRRG